MYSVNVPVPAAVGRLASGLAADLREAAAREDHTLVVKRVTDSTDPKGGAVATADRRGGRGDAAAEPDGARPGGVGSHTEVLRRVRTVTAATAPFAATVTGIELFETPPTGQGPVAYLAVDSPGLCALHRSLCEYYEPVEGLEGASYVPHVTVARGGDAADLAGRELAYEWTIDRLEVLGDGGGTVLGSVALGE